MDDAPFEAGLPHLAVVVLWYPLFTQPFIFRELESLGGVMPLEIYTLYDRNLRHCSSEMKEASGRAHTFGVKSAGTVCLETGRAFFRQPRKMARLFYRAMWRKWPDLETFGENLWGFFVGAALGRRFQEEGIELVYAPWPRGAATAAWVGASLAGIPFVMAARGDNLAPADPDLADKFANSILIRANNAADMERIEAFAGGVAKGKTRLVYNSLTLPRVPDASDRKPATITRLLALGRFDVTKGFDILLQACAILKARGFPFHLTLAGGGGKIMGLGDMGKNLRALRRKLDLEQEVSMPGLVTHDELPGLMGEHDIFIAPCVIHESGRRDGIPNTVIEAMACAMPIISTNVNALPEVIRNGETGIAIDPGDPEALANAIMKLSADHDLAARLARNAATLSRDMFDPHKNAMRLRDMFLSVSPPKNTCAE